MAAEGEGEKVEVATELPPPPPDSSAVEQPEKVEKPVKEKKAKVPKEKKPRSAKPSTPAHPPYFQMIKEALTSLQEKSGSSPYAIAKYMEVKHKDVLPANFRKILALQLKNCVIKGKLIKIKASFKLSESGKKDEVVKGAKSVAEKNKSKVVKPKSGVAAPKGSKPVKKTANPMKKEAAKKVAPKKKRSAPAKPRQPKSIKSPVAKKAKKAIAA